MNGGIRRPLGHGVASLAMIISATVTAQTEPAGREVAPSGHGERLLAAAPRPVMIMDREDIRLSGSKQLADLLRRSVRNSFGSYRETSGHGPAQNAFLDLDGLGAGNTLILVNGRRVPGSPLAGGSGVDLNTLPLFAVERIEFLPPGAAAIHGPNALGGVVNVVLRDAVDGTEVEATAERPTRAGADAEHVSVLWGGRFDRARLTFGAEHFARAAIGDMDRAWSRALWTPGGAFADTRNVSVAGNTVFSSDFSQARALGDCDPAVYTGVLSDPLDTTGATGCGYPFANHSLLTGSLERTGVLLGAEHAIDAPGRGAVAYLDVRYTRGETGGRFAPALAPGFAVPCDALSGSVPSSFCSGSEPVIVAHRFVAHGNRDERVALDEHDLVVGLRGVLGGGVGYDASLRHYRYDALQTSGTYVSARRMTDAVLAGEYDFAEPPRTSPEVIRRTGLERRRDLLTDHRALRASLDGSAAVPDGSALRWLVGVDYAEQRYRDVYDYRNAYGATSEPGDALGSAGASARGERARGAAFGRTSVSPLDDVALVVAARFDDYDDVGSMFSRQAAAHWRPSAHLALRASWDRGFNAPGLHALHGEESSEYPGCPSGSTCEGGAQVEVVRSGNPELRAEAAERVNVGATAGWGDFSLGADYFEVAISDPMTSLSLDEVLRLERLGALPPGAAVERSGDVITRILSPTINRAGATVDVRGVGLGARVGWDIGPAAVALNARWARLVRFDEPSGQVRLGGSGGGRGFPEDRLNVTLDATSGRLTGRWAVHVISGFDNPQRTGRYGAWVGHDLALLWRDPFGLAGAELAAGVRNLTDRDPPLDPHAAYHIATSPVLDLYPVEGRTLYLTVSHRW